jgi:hypothetical protein
MPPERALCPACQERRRFPRAYLCPPCWLRLPLDTRTALWTRDGQEVARFRALLKALRARRPLEEIVI